MKSMKLIKDMKEVLAAREVKEVSFKSIKDMKAEQIAGAKEIKELRLKMKDSQRGKIPKSVLYSQDTLREKSWEWRHRHIAYCMLRGKTYVQIEPKTRDGNGPNMDYVEKIMLQYETQTWSEEQNQEVGGDRGQSKKALCVSQA